MFTPPAKLHVCQWNPQLKGISCRDHVSSRTVNTSSFQIYVCDARPYIDRCPIGFQQSVAFIVPPQEFFFQFQRLSCIGFFFQFSLYARTHVTPDLHTHESQSRGHSIEKIVFVPDRQVCVHRRDTIFENRVK